MGLSSACPSPSSSVSSEVNQKSNIDSTVVDGVDKADVNDIKINNNNYSTPFVIDNITTLSSSLSLPSSPLTHCLLPKGIERYGNNDETSCNQKIRIQLVIQKQLKLKQTMMINL